MRAVCLADITLGGSDVAAIVASVARAETQADSDRPLVAPLRHTAADAQVAVGGCVAVVRRVEAWRTENEIDGSCSTLLLDDC